MNLLQTIDTARGFLKDPLPATRSFPDDSSTFFTDTEMTRWYNMEQNSVQNQMIQTFENWFVTSTSITTVANTEEYTMPTDLVKVIRLEDYQNSQSPREMYPISFNSKDRYSSQYPWENTGTNLPGFYAIRGGNLVLRPIPKKASELKLYYSYRIPERVSATSCSAIPDEYHELMMWGMVKKGLVKQESTPEAYALAVQEYTRLLNELKSTSDNRQAQRSRRVKRRRGRGYYG